MTDDAVLGAIDPHVLRSAFACFPSGVTALCAMVDGQPTGMAASSFTSVSLDPPLVSVCVAHTSTTWPVLSRAERLGVSVLSDVHSQVAQALSAKGTDRFAEVDWGHAEKGAIFVHGSTLWLSCAVHGSFPAGDHDVVLLRIVSLRSYPEVAPMVFHRSAFRSLAPTELPASPYRACVTPFLSVTGLAVRSRREVDKHDLGADSSRSYSSGGPTEHSPAWHRRRSRVITTG